MTFSKPFVDNQSRNRRKFAGTYAEAKKMSRDQLLDRLKWYTDEVYKRIASSLGTTMLVARIRYYEVEFEKAAHWWWMERPDPSRPRYSKVIKQLSKIRDAADKLHWLARPDAGRPMPSDFQFRDAADKLLVYLRIDDLLDGSTARDARVCELLLDVEPFIGAADLEELAYKVERLVNVVFVTAELKRRAEAPIADALELSRLTELKGHPGDICLNDWVAWIVNIYKELMGAKGIASDRAGQGQAKSLPAFLEKAATPLSICQTQAQLRRRVRTALENQTTD